MKHVLAAALAVALSACAATGTLHKPTTDRNAGTQGLAAYALAGATAGLYLGLPPCGAGAPLACKTQALADKVNAADKAAHDAAIAADAALNDAAKADTAATKKAALDEVLADPQVKAAVDSAKAANGSTP